MAKYIDLPNLKENLTNFLNKKIDPIYAKKTEVPQGTVVDDALSSTSTNPVQNKVVKSEFDKVNSNLSELKYGEVAGGKNLLKFNVLSVITSNSITYTPKYDKNGLLLGIHAEGTASSDSYYTLSSQIILQPGTYSFSGGYSGDALLFYEGANGSTEWFRETVKTLTKVSTIGCGIYIPKGKTVNYDFKPMIVETSVFDNKYEPYIPSIAMLEDEVDNVKNDLSDLKDGTTPVAKAVADEDGNNIKSTYAKKTELDTKANSADPVFTGSFSQNRKAGSTIGTNSHAEGDDTEASGEGSHAEGEFTIASGEGSHAEGASTIASNFSSHAAGKYNAPMTTGGTLRNSTGTAFVIGNGTSAALSNAFSVQYDGTVKAKSTITASTTADYAEFFEWLDENPNNEDRVGYFVTLDGDKIKIASDNDDYILGIVSGEPFVLGNGDCDTWNGMYLHDEFRRTIYEPAPKVEEVEIKEEQEETYIDEETGEEKTRTVEVVVGHEFKEVKGEFDGTRPKLNPDYDNTQQYVSRFDRKEWSPVGMLGVLAVRHDGTAKVNGYVTVNKNGIATACDRNIENSYRVIKANTDSVIEVIFK